MASVPGYFYLFYLFLEKSMPLGHTIKNVGGWADAFRTLDWAKAFPVPDLALKEIKQLLALA